MQNTLARPLWTPDRVIDVPQALQAKRGMELVNLAKLGILPGISGGRTAGAAHGYNVRSDIVTQTADGRDLNAIWNDFMALLNSVNADRTALVNFLTFPVTQPLEAVAQLGAGVDFEPASEYGEPVGARIAPNYFNLAYTFQWYDLAARYTWQYLADATTTMVESVANAAVEAYNRLLMNSVFKTVFNNTNLSATINGAPYTVYKFYNNDGTIPPTYKNNVFDGTHNHFKTTGSQGVNSAALEPSDLDVLVIDDFASHGYSQDNGYRIVAMVNSAVGNTIRTFRAGTNGARYDFIPAVGQPGQLITLTQQIVGQAQIANTLDGLNVIGNYGPVAIVQDDWMPTTHVFTFATGGPASLGNPVGLREHANANLRGLRLVKGRQPEYPLIDSFWAVGFGTGVRQRGGGIVLQLASGSTYAPPAAFV